MPPADNLGARFWDYFILTTRFLLAYTFMHYGYIKLTGSQFGLSSEQAAQPVNQLSLFELSWYFFAQEPFKSFVGISQIVAGLLLLWNRTALLGALLLLPIAANVLVIDITYLKISGFYWRLSYYILLIFLLFWHYRDRMLIALRALTVGLSTRFAFPWWAYLLLPMAAIVTEIIGVTPQLVLSFLASPQGTWRSLAELLHLALVAVGLHSK